MPESCHDESADIINGTRAAMKVDFYNASNTRLDAQVLGAAFASGAELRWYSRNLLAPHAQLKRLGVMQTTAMSVKGEAASD